MNWPLWHCILPAVRKLPPESAFVLGLLVGSTTARDVATRLGMSETLLGRMIENLLVDLGPEPTWGLRDLDSMDV
jgi:hypothetical protein